MRFTFPVITLCHGGAQRMLAEITNGLVDKGHEVTIVMPRQGITEYEVRSRIIQTPNMDLYGEDYPDGDVIVSNFYTTVAPSEVASRQGKGIHMRLSLCYEPAFLYDNHLSFPSYHVTNKLMVLSEWQQDLIQLLYGIKGHIVPIGVSSYFQNLHIREQIAEPLNISAILRRIESEFSWHREQDYLISQLNLVQERYPGIIINLICPPQEFQESPNLQGLRDTGRYRILTPANDEELRYHYNHTDIFVSSGTYDAGSLPGLEAMRCGAALVTVYSGGNVKYAVHERNCLMSYRYENRLAQDVIRLIEDPQLRQSLAAAGEKVSYQYNWKQSVDLFERAVVKLASH